MIASPLAQYLLPQLSLPVLPLAFSNTLQGPYRPTLGTRIYPSAKKRRAFTAPPVCAIFKDTPCAFSPPLTAVQYSRSYLLPFHVPLPLYRPTRSFHFPFAMTRRPSFFSVFLSTLCPHYLPHQVGSRRAAGPARLRPCQLSSPCSFVKLSPIKYFPLTSSSLSFLLPFFSEGRGRCIGM